MAAFVIIALPRDSTGQIEHMKFDRGVTQQMREIPESLGVLEAKGFSAVADGPVLALFVEDPFLRRTDAGHRIAGSSRARSRARRVRCHLNSLGRSCPIPAEQRFHK